jgi:hypothetical protein
MANGVLPEVVIAGTPDSQMKVDAVFGTMNLG